MERHVKERIVGAAIIVALGVWLIPWVLDGPEQATETSQAAGSQILPAAGNTTPIRTETVELDPGPPGEPLEQVAADADSEPVAVVASSPEATEVASEPNTAGPANTETAAATRAATASPNTRARDGWMVQLGAFGDLTNAEQLAARVSTYGYSAFVSEFRSGGQTMHRVRVGGFETETQADAAASSLSAHGFPGRVIAPE